MLVSLADVIRAGGRRAVLACDVLEHLLIPEIVETACRWTAPVILMVLQEDFSTDPRDTRVTWKERWIANQIQAAARFASVPICFHLDHALTVDVVKKWLDLGVSGVMLDAHDQPIAANIQLTQQVYEIAVRYGATVETEVGDPAGVSQTGTALGPGSLTEVAELLAMHEAVDPSVLLAAAVGQGHNSPAPKEGISFQRLAEICEVLPPWRFLALHGGSGIPTEQVARAVREFQVRKLNLYADNRAGVKTGLLGGVSAFAAGDRSPKLRPLLNAVEAEVVAVVESRLEVCGYSRPV
jgi:fructose/tagatose bisphosphate aldolase